MDRNAEINYLLAELEAAVEEYGLIQEVKDAFQQFVRDGVLLGQGSKGLINEAQGDNKGTGERLTTWQRHCAQEAPVDVPEEDPGLLGTGELKVKETPSKTARVGDVMCVAVDADAPKKVRKRDAKANETVRTVPSISTPIQEGCSHLPIHINPGRPIPTEEDLLRDVRAIGSPWSWAARAMTQPSCEAVALDKKVGNVCEFEHSVGAVIFHGTPFVRGLTPIVEFMQDKKNRGSVQSEFIPSACWIWVSEESGLDTLWEFLCKGVAQATETEAFRPYVHAPHIAGKALRAIDEDLARHDAERAAQALEESDTDAGDDVQSDYSSDLD